MKHEPVMLGEVLQWLAPKKGGVFYDLTAGAGGHLKAMLEKLTPKRMVGVDQDPENIRDLRALQADFPALELFEGNFADFLRGAPAGAADGILMDLGYHSGQLDRVPGLAYEGDSFLDMRLSPHTDTTAAELLVKMDEAELTWLLAEYGETHRGTGLARKIKRELPGRLEDITTAWLVGLIRRFDPNPPRANRKIRQVFQALRIAVNRELEHLKEAMEACKTALADGGRLLVLTFHSIEDRLVKHAFKAMQAEGWGRVLTKKAHKPTQEETRANPRAKSALLRVIEKGNPQQEATP